MREQLIAHRLLSDLRRAHPRAGFFAIAAGATFSGLLANHVAGFARCFVCVQGQNVQGQNDRVVGYYTLSAVSVEHAQLPGRARRNAPDPVPAVLLGRPAADRAVQGPGLGKLLIRDALLSTLAAADRVGVRLLIVHALRKEAAAFYAALGFTPSPTDPLHLYVLLKDARASLDG